MELKVSSPKLGGGSLSDCISDPEEKEVGDEDDDDRNHKHRRRDRHPQSLERDSMDPLFTRPYGKHKKPFENGHPVRENVSLAGEAWKNSNGLPPENDLTSKFDRKHPGFASLPRGNLDLNQRIRSNQTFNRDSGSGRGRGRDNSSWNQHDSRFNFVDIASQMVQPGSVAPGLFARRGLQNVSIAQSPSWSTFGLMPGIPNGSLDTLHPLGLQGILRPLTNSSLNRCIPRQCCRDFEERGFCLRADMCPMEHGVNRIVVEDVQKYGSLDSIEPVKDILEKDQKGFDTSLVAAIDRTMKKHTDNLMHMLEGVGDRLTQLESRTSNLETSVDDLKMSVGNNHGSIDGKMRQLENILKEVQTEVHVVKEKQESVEALLQHAKLQETKMDQPSETHNTAHIGSMQQVASAPFQSHQQLPLAASFPQSLSSVPPPPPPTVPPPALPQQNLSPPVQHPDQFPQSQVPSVPQRDAYYTPPAQTQEIPSQQFSMPPTQQVPSVPQRDAYYPPPGQTQEAPSQHFPMPPTQQQQPPPAAPTHQPYQPAPPLLYSQPPQPLQGQPSMGHHPDEAAYVPSQTYPPNLRQPPSQQPSGPPSSQQYFGTPPQMHEPPSRRPGPGFSTGYVPQSGPSEQYAYGGSPPQYGSASPMKLQQLPSSTGSGYPQLPTARVLPHALPTVSGGGGESAPSGPGNRVPIDDVVDKVTGMGFPRDHVRATVRKLTENGQSVDLNVVLDKLMNDSDIQPPRAWFGR